MNHKNEKPTAPGNRNQLQRRESNLTCHHGKPAQPTWIELLGQK